MILRTVTVSVLILVGLPPLAGTAGAQPIPDEVLTIAGLSASDKQRVL